MQIKQNEYLKHDTNNLRAIINWIIYTPSNPWIDLFQVLSYPFFIKTP